MKARTKAGRAVLQDLVVSMADDLWSFHTASGQAEYVEEAADKLDDGAEATEAIAKALRDFIIAHRGAIVARALKAMANLE